MSVPPIGRLQSVPALDRPELLAAPVHAALLGWPGGGGVGVVEIDPALADTAAMSEAYDVPLGVSANCVVVAGRRGGDERIAACVVTAVTRADVNGCVRRALDVRKASFLPMERAVAETAMEYGGITPIGLPDDWRLLIDSRVTTVGRAIIGAGIRGAKLWLPGAVLAALPGAEVVEGLAAPIV